MTSDQHEIVYGTRKDAIELRLGGTFHKSAGGCGECSAIASAGRIRHIGPQLSKGPSEETTARQSNLGGARRRRLCTPHIFTPGPFSTEQWCADGTGSRIDRERWVPVPYPSVAITPVQQSISVGSATARRHAASATSYATKPAFQRGSRNNKLHLFPASRLQAAALLSSIAPERRRQTRQQSRSHPQPACCFAVRVVMDGGTGDHFSTCCMRAAPCAGGSLIFVESSAGETGAASSVGSGFAWLSSRVEHAAPARTVGRLAGPRVSGRC